jgi:hypothetical protein
VFLAAPRMRKVSESLLYKELMIFGKGVSEVTKARNVSGWTAKVTAEPSSKATQWICSHCIFIWP